MNTDPLPITSEVLLKLKTQDTVNLPLACRACSAALWQTVGKLSKPDKLQVRCYCRVMHTFVWDEKNNQEILDCDLLYLEEKEGEPGDTGPQDNDLDSLPPFLRQQLAAQQAEDHGGHPGPSLE